MNRFKILMLVFLSTILISCGEDKDENTWVVGTSADNPPYEYMRNGEIVGFDVDLIIAIGQHLGKNVKFRNMEFHGLLAALSGNNVDMVIAGMSVTKRRQRRVTFSIPYTDAKIAFLYKTKDLLGRIESLQDKKVGVQLGTIWSLIAHDLSLQHDFHIKSLDSNLMLVEELKNKRIDALILEKSQAEAFISKNPEFSNFLAEQYSSSFAIALPKKTKLKRNIDHAIEELRNNGTIETLARKWGISGAE